MRLTEFTDPFCTWCWGAEPVLRRVAETYGEQVTIEFVMGGLVEDFETFCDAGNGISEPADVAPHWETAARRHGMPVDTGVWLHDPPQSSYPACIAYEAATFQGRDLAHRYLRRLREAVATEQRNIASRDVLLELAGEVGLDIEQFRDALDGDSARTAFEEDRQYTRKRGARTFPSFEVATDDDERLLGGSQSFERLAEVIETLDPDLDRQSPRPLEAFVDHYGTVAAVEVAEVYQLDTDEARARLDALAADGVVDKRPCGTGSLWQAI